MDSNLIFILGACHSNTIYIPRKVDLKKEIGCTKTFSTLLTGYGQEPRKDAREINCDFQKGFPFIYLVNAQHRGRSGNGKNALWV